MLDDKDIRQKNHQVFEKADARYISGEANYGKYVLLFIHDGSSGRPLVMTLERTPAGYKRTNAPSRDDTFDIVWSALRSGDVKALK